MSSPSNPAVPVSPPWPMSKMAGELKTLGVAVMTWLSKTGGVLKTAGVILNRSTAREDYPTKRSTTREDYSKMSITTYIMTAGRVMRSTNWKEFLM
jgi:hypothetical protein